MKHVLVALVLLLSWPARAEFYTGNELVQRMRAYQQSAAGQVPSSYADASAYMFFVAGVHDTLDNLDIFCTPANSTLGQVAAVVEKYLVAHPERWANAASTLVADALREAFPCKAGK